MSCYIRPNVAQQQQQHSRSCDSDDVQCHTDVGLLESEHSLFHIHSLLAELAPHTPC